MKKTTDDPVKREQVETLIRQGLTVSDIYRLTGVRTPTTRRIATEIGVIIPDGNKRRSDSRRKPPTIGSRIGHLTVIGDAIYSGTRGTHARVKVRCTCGVEKMINIHSLNTHRKSYKDRFCSITCPDRKWASGTANPLYMGNDHPRTPSAYRAEFKCLQEGLCAWCSNPLDDKNASVDHDHTIHDGCSGAVTCRACVRGVVHQSCNLEIKNWDWALKVGIGPISEDKLRYLNKRKVGR